MKNIAIIPARSGSKGLEDKNIKLLNGKPLIVYTIEAAKDSKVFDEIITSTDSQVYANIAEKYCANIPFLRPDYLSNDIAVSADVIDEEKNKYDEEENFSHIYKIAEVSTNIKIFFCHNF